MTTPDASADAVPLTPDPDVAAADATAPAAAETADAPPVPATWQSLEPTEPFCPPEIAAHAPAWLAARPARDTVTQAQALEGGWHVVAASVRGRAHAHRGDHREDAFAVESAPGVIALCAADGAGSSRFSRLGAELACTTTAQRIVAAVAPRLSAADMSRDALAQLAGQAIGRAVWEACRDLHDLAAASGTTPADYRCTLLVGVLVTSGSQSLLVTSQVGDGAIVVARRDGSLLRLGEADSGDYAGEVRCFVPDAQAPARAAHVRVTDAEALEAILLLTDGVDDPWYPVERTAAIMLSQWRTGTGAAPEAIAQRATGPVFGEADPGARLAEWLGFERRGENDDRTAVVCYRPPV